MISPEQNIIIKKFWDSMLQIDKLNILSENDFWEGLSVYNYEYIPEDLKEVLLLKIKDKGVN